MGLNQELLATKSRKIKEWYLTREKIISGWHNQYDLDTLIRNSYTGEDEFESKLCLDYDDFENIFEKLGEKINNSESEEAEFYKTVKESFDEAFKLLEKPDTYIHYESY